MANVSAIKKVRHVVTQAEIDTGTLEVAILWDSPFYDTNYAVSFAVEAEKASNILKYASSNIGELSPAGFTTVVILDQALATAGDVIIIHALASHK